MDPDKALEELREKMARMQYLLDQDVARDDSKEGDEFEELANRVVDLWNGLDHWISIGGARPQDWVK